MKIGLSYSTPMSYLWQRAFFSTFMMAPFLLPHRKEIRMEARVIAILVMSSVAWAFSQSFMMFALGSTSSGMSAIITYSQPLFVFAMSVFFLRGEATRLKMASVLLGFAGIGMIYLESFGSGMGSTQAILLLLLGAFLWAVSIVGYKLIADVVHPYWMSFSEVAFGSVIILPLALSTGGITFSLNFPYILSVVYITLVSTVIAFFLWFYLLKNEDAVAVSSSSLLVPIIAFVLGVIILRETLNLNQVVGIVMVMMGVYFVNMKPAHAISAESGNRRPHLELES